MNIFLTFIIQPCTAWCQWNASKMRGRITFRFSATKLTMWSLLQKKSARSATCHFSMLETNKN
jgi:hypothetical protein